jgi:hypothetical protein
MHLSNVSLRNMDACHTRYCDIEVGEPPQASVFSALIILVHADWSKNCFKFELFSPMRVPMSGGCI